MLLISRSNSVEMFLMGESCYGSMRRSFKKTLEDKANELVAKLPRQAWDVSIPATLRREIALTVEQIEQLRNQYDRQFRKLLNIECYVGTELRQLRAGIPLYTHAHFPETEKLHKRLFDIEKQRRDLSLRLDEKNRGLESKLLTLINQHDQLEF